MIFRSVGVHDGSFHADEVTACAFLLMYDLIDKDKIFRTRNEEVLSNCEYVCDVGGVYDPNEKKFDHHQSDYSGNLSSAGMVLLYLKNQNLLSEGLYDFFNHTLVMGVDANDIGDYKPKIGVWTFSDIIANFLPVDYNSSFQEKDVAFKEAVDFTRHHLSVLKERYGYRQKTREIVEDTMKISTDYMFFNRAFPWLDTFFELGGEEHPALFIVMPAGAQWKLRAVPPSYEDRMNVRKPLPKHWAGLHGKDLEEVSGIKGAVFCHKGLFISIWETKEAALKALETALKD